MKNKRENFTEPLSCSRIFPRCLWRLQECLKLDTVFEEGAHLSLRNWLAGGITPDTSDGSQIIYVSLQHAGGRGGHCLSSQLFWVRRKKQKGTKTETDTQENIKQKIRLGLVKFHSLEELRSITNNRGESPPNFPLFIANWKTALFRFAIMCLHEGKSKGGICFEIDETLSDQIPLQ